VKTVASHDRVRAAGTQEFVAPRRAVPTDNVDLAAGIVQGRGQVVAGPNLGITFTSDFATVPPGVFGPPFLSGQLMSDSGTMDVAVCPWPILVCLVNSTLGILLPVLPNLLIVVEIELAVDMLHASGCAALPHSPHPTCVRLQGL